MNVAYVRVSTIEQNEARQLEGLKNREIERWYTEKVKNVFIETGAEEVTVKGNFVQENVNLVQEEA